MKIRAIVSLFLLLNFAVETAFADESKAWTIDSSAGFFSNYMFRGQSLYDGPSIQPSLTANYDTGHGTVSANLWMHITGETNKPERFTELDATLKFSDTVGDFIYSFGNAWYTYSDYGDGTDIDDSAEVFASLTYDTTLAPTLSVYHDWNEYDLVYYELGLSHEITDALGAGGNVTPFVGLGFASNGDKIYEDDGLVQVTTGVSTSATIGDVSMTPVLNYSFKVDDNTINQFWFGVTFDYSI